MTKKFALIGTGSRGIYMFAQPILKEYKEHAAICALFDSNIERAKAGNKILKTDIPTFDDFEKMLETCKPDGLIIASSDATHAQYIIKGLENNLIVYSEKPLCVDAEQVAAIRKASAASKGYLYVTHNMRYGPHMTKIKEMIEEGRIGKLLAIEFNEMLDRNHGADYFRRWHGRKKNSGGLLIHKASHHFDVLNWFANSKPNNLNAKGGTLYYGKNGPFRSVRCKGCEHASKCPYYWDIEKHEVSKTLYQAVEKVDGYFRDGCLFAEDIDTEDFTSVIYDYENGIQVSYALNAFASYEGMRIVLEGTDARLEYESAKRTAWVAGSNVVHGQEKAVGSKLQLIHPTEGITEIEVEAREGSHGGADPALRDDLFRDFLKNKKPTARMAGAEDAIQAVLVGIAGNVSIANNSKTIEVQKL